jgi:hypothetical protein
MMKNSIGHIGYYFNSQRMMRRYASEAYLRQRRKWTGARSIWTAKLLKLQPVIWPMRTAVSALTSKDQIKKTLNFPCSACARAARSSRRAQQRDTGQMDRYEIGLMDQTSAWRVDLGQGPLPPIAYSLDFPDEMIAALLLIWGPASRNWRFLFAAAELNVAPAECFVVEGSPRRYLGCPRAGNIAAPRVV